MEIRWLVRVVVVCAAACGTPTHDSQLTQITPATVTSLVATPGQVHGNGLDALASIDLDDRGSAHVDRAWQVRIDDIAVSDAKWVDSETIDVTIPKGLAVGVHNVFATSPDGRELALPHALTVTAEPVGLTLSIEDAPGGSGTAVAGTFVAGAQVAAFAVVRDAQHAFVADVAVDWAMTATLGTLSSTSGSSVSLTATRAGTGRLTAHHVAAALDAQSDLLVVVAAPAVRIAIEDAAGGTGAVIGDRSGLTTDSDGGLSAYAVSLDAFDNFVADEPVTWSLTGITGLLPVTSVLNAAVDFTTPGVGVLHATHASLGTAQTGVLTVGPGRAAVLTIVPSVQTLSADASPFAFGATAIDADGNLTTNLGTLTWSVANGPITALAPATGVLDPVSAGTGTIAVASSWGPSATSGAITITPGAPVGVVVSPQPVTISADAPPMLFTAAFADADGNATIPATTTWAVASGPISTIGALTGIFDPKTAGTGTITATAPNGASGSAMVTVTPGRAATLAILPATLVASQGGSAVPFTATAKDSDGNATTDIGTLAWSIATGPIASIDGTTGAFLPTTPGTGTIRATSSYGATSTTGSIQINSAAALVPSMNTPVNVSVGQTFSVAMTVTNPGQDAAANVTACALALGGTGTATIVSAPSPVATIAGGGNAVLTWTVTATAAGTLTFTTCVGATDAVTAVPITAPASASTTALVAPQLTATLAVAPVLGRGASFTVTMVVTNSGGVAATGVVPSALAVTGTGTVTLVTAPSGASIGAGGNATFQWTYTATGLGTIQLQGSATGTNALSAAVVTCPPATSNVADIVEAYVAASDPFGDGSAFGFVTGYRGEVHVGPNRTGTAAVRMPPDASNVELMSFAFNRDVSGNTTSNAANPYTSIGAPGCTAGTSACGPDNENQRGLFAGVTFLGAEWLIATGAVAAQTAAYIYMTTSTGTALSFRYVDLSSVIAGGSSYGASALGVVGNRLYVGTAGTNGGRSQLIAVTTSPPSPGLDVNNGDAADMHLENLPPWANGTNPGNVDAIASVGSLVYVANKNAWIRSDAASPVPMPDTCLLCCLLGCTINWVDITPSAAAYGNKTSRSTAKGGGLEPADRAVPQIVSFGGRVFAARNTTAGPQLWACTPTNSRCDSNDWALVAPNSTGDTQLTQFNNPALTSVSMLAATPGFLYVGFDSAAGLQIFRTSNAAASTRAAFEGQAGCSAANHPATCAGYGGTGLGDPTNNTRIFDGKALTFGAATSVWLTTGNGANAASIVTLP